MVSPKNTYFDFKDAFSPVINPQNVCIVLIFAFSYRWTFHRIDVNNVFLHGALTKEVYIIQPPGFE